MIFLDYKPLGKIQIILELKFECFSFMYLHLFILRFKIED